MARVFSALPVILAAAIGIGSGDLGDDVILLTKVLDHCIEKFQPLREEDVKTRNKRDRINSNCAVSEMLLRNKFMTMKGFGMATDALKSQDKVIKLMLMLAVFLQEDNSPAAAADASGYDEQQSGTAESGHPTAEECKQLQQVYDDERWPKPKVSGIRAVAEWRRDTKGLVMQAVADCYGQKVGSASPRNDDEDIFSQQLVGKAWGVKKGQKGSAENPSELEALEALAFFNCAVAGVAKNKKMSGKKFSELLEYGIMEWLYNFSTADLAKDFAAGKRPSDMEYPWMMPKTDVCLQNRAAIYGMKRFHKFIDTHIRNAKL